MPVTEIDSTTFRSEVLESDLPVVVDFYADWCGPCHQVSPVVEQLSQRWDGRIRFAKVDVDASQDVAGAYRISSIPAILLFVGGEPKAWSIGAKSAAALERELGLARAAGADADDGSAAEASPGLLGRMRRLLWADR